MEAQSESKSRRNPGRRVAAAVLAGGAASRMGGGKAEALLAGRPLVEYPVMALRRAGLAPFVVTKADRPVSLSGVDIIIEPPEPRHPLLGVATALRAAPGRAVLVVACDLPLLPPDLLIWLAGCEGNAVVPRVSGRLQPLAALYGPDCLSKVEAGLAAGRSVTATVLALDPAIVEESDLARFGDPATSFHNVNTPADLSWAEKHLTGE